MTDTELIAWLQLAAVPSLGGSRIQRLLADTSPSQLVAMTAEQLQQYGLTAKQIQALLQPNQQRLEHALQWQQAPQSRASTHDDLKSPPANL